MAPPMTECSLILGYLKLCSRGASAGREATNSSYGTHARSHARWGVAYIPPTRPTLLHRHVKVQKYSHPYSIRGLVILDLAMPI